MRKAELDYILGKMLDKDKGVSDLNFTVGKTPQVETSGMLIDVPINPRNSFNTCQRLLASRQSLIELPCDQVDVKGVPGSLL